MTDRGRTIRQAIDAALEALPACGRDLAPDVVLVHVKRWVHDYSSRRGVLLDDRDITTEFESMRAAR